jgi:hypothetical protein
MKEIPKFVAKRCPSCVGYESGKTSIGAVAKKKSPETRPVTYDLPTGTTRLRFVLGTPIPGRCLRVRKNAFLFKQLVLMADDPDMVDLLDEYIGSFEGTVSDIKSSLDRFLI